MKKTIKVKAVIFDRDGVIINTEGVHINSIRHAFNQLGFKLSENDISQVIGKSHEVYRHYFLSKWNFDFETYHKIQREYFYQNLEEAEYFPETLKLVKYLHTRNIPIAVTTSAGKEGTELIFNKVGIYNLFQVIITKNDVENLKPHPEPYIKTAEQLGVDPKFCVVIEDTALGVEAAKKAGMNCIAIPNEYTKDQDFSAADFILDSAKEINDILNFI